MGTSNPFGDWLREKLFDLRLKQRDLSRQAKSCGIEGLSSQYINRVINAERNYLEKGEPIPAWERHTVVKIARALANGRDTYVQEALDVAGYKTSEGAYSDGEMAISANGNRPIKIELERLRNDLKTALDTIDRLADLIEESEEPQAAAWAELEACFGLGDSGDPNASDNDRIDADLARAYADNHQEAA
jgi:hypothetical protein